MSHSTQEVKKGRNIVKYKKIEKNMLSAQRKKHIFPRLTTDSMSHSAQEVNLCTPESIRSQPLVSIKVFP